MEVVKIANENIPDLMNYSKNSFAEGKEIFVLTTVMTYLYFENDKKKKWTEELIVRGIKFLMVIFVCVHPLFIFIGSKSKKGVSITQTIKWILIPFSEISKDPKTKFYLFEQNLLFGEQYKNVESSLRIYIAVLLCLQVMQIIKIKWKRISPLKELAINTIVYVFVLGLMICAVAYVDMVTALAILPIFVTMQILVIDRLLMYIQQNSLYNFDFIVHRGIVDFFKDVFYSVECGKARYSYTLNVNTNTMLTFTSIVIFLNICYTLYNKGK